MGERLAVWFGKVNDKVLTAQNSLLPPCQLMTGVGSLSASLGFSAIAALIQTSPGFQNVGKPHCWLDVCDSPVSGVHFPKHLVNRSLVSKHRRNNSSQDTALILRLERRQSQTQSIMGQCGVCSSREKGQTESGLGHQGRLCGGSDVTYLFIFNYLFI